jgi:short-subunit dehydrogenase
LGVSASPRWSRALVTGASSGIGDAFARRLAGEGTDLVVVARSADRLDGLAAELRTRHGVDVEVLPADLTDGADVAKIEDRLRVVDRPVDLLINNAGFGTSGAFLDLPVDREDEMIRLNVLALVRLTHAALDAMRGRGRGNVVNISSTGSFQPLPTFATYAATKAFVTSFTEAVHEEVRRDGLGVTVVCPGFTRTNFADVAGAHDQSRLPSFVWMTADEVARIGLDAAARNDALCVTGAKNRIAAALVGAMPRRLVRRITGLGARIR